MTDYIRRVLLSLFGFGKPVIVSTRRLHRG